MFNTLGNLVANPSAGLRFVDFSSGGVLQLTGRAEVWPDFSVVVQVEEVRETPGACPSRFDPTDETLAARAGSRARDASGRAWPPP